MTNTLISKHNNLDKLRVVLAQTRNPLNIGAAARAMSNFGVMKLRVVNPYEAAFREARSAVGAAVLLANAETFDDVAEAVDDCKLVVGTTVAGSKRDLQHRLLRLEDAGRVIKRKLKTAPVAILFGSERYGLSNEELSHCNWLMRIPTREEHGSMNLGQAVAVSLYEIIRDSKASSEKSQPIAKKIKKENTAATSGSIERMTHDLFEILDASGYVKPDADAPTQENLRRMIRRMEINSNDADMWLGMLRQIAWKLGTKYRGK
jgi:TrmH family RNA methyltransferase